MDDLTQLPGASPMYVPPTDTRQPAVCPLCGGDGQKPVDGVKVPCNGCGGRGIVWPAFLLTLEPSGGCRGGTALPPPDLNDMVEECTVRQAVPKDCGYIVSLMKRNRESLGFLPIACVDEKIESGRVILAEINGQAVGYIIHQGSNGVLRIPQACIQYDARRRQYGEAMVQQLFASCIHRVSEIRLRCAADLEANLFWRDMGFTCTGQAAGGRRRGRTINLWRKWIDPALFSPHEFAVEPSAELRTDSMYDESGFLTQSPSGFKDARLLPKLAWANRRI